jgi:2-polyprenyl-3-methyl-5-hydroxy-6-metoxy-1,4-benzoquinol methylase
MQRAKPPLSHCKLCGATELLKLFETSPKAISEVYRSLYGVDLKAVGCQLPVTPIAMLRCTHCELRQFSPDWIGSPGLYEALQTFPWYYQASKYEFQVAKKLVQTGNSVLEIGCATGNFRQHLPDDITYTGLEFNQRAIDAARLRGMNVSATPLEQVARDHPASFDAAFAFQVLEHVSQPREFLLGMVAAVKPGGLVVFSVPNEDSFLRHEVNNVTNFPPHHATRWCDTTFERLGALLGAQLVNVVYEPLTKDHRSAYANAQIWRVISSLLPAGRNGVSVAASNRWVRRLISLAGLPIRLWIAMSSTALRGHTVVVTLRKS